MTDHRRLVFQASNLLDDPLYANALQLPGTEPGILKRERFGDGEIRHQMISYGNARDTIVVGSLATNSSKLDLFDTLCLVMDEGARGLTIVIDDPSLRPNGEEIDPAFQALQQHCLEGMLSAIPPSAGGNLVVRIDGSSIDAKGLAEALAAAKPFEQQVRLFPEIQPEVDLFPDKPGRKLVFSTGKYKRLRNKILEAGNGHFDLGLFNAECFTFDTEVKNRDVVIVSGTTDDDETMELWYLANALVNAGAGALEIVLAYYGYGRQERKSKSGEAVKAEYRARLFSHIPRCPIRIKITMLDLHADGIPYYFDKKRVRTEHLYVAEHLVRHVLRELFGYDQFLAGQHDPDMVELALKLALGSTDAGRAKWVEQMARQLLVDCVICHKRHKAETQGADIANEKVDVYAYVGKIVKMLIAVYDDICSTATTAIEALDLYVREGADVLVFIITHGLFVGNAVGNLLKAVNANGPMKYVYATDTHWRAVQVYEDLQAAGVDLLRMFSVAPIIADYLLNGHPLDRARRNE